MRNSAAKAAELNNPALIMEPGHVTQIWSDGEITSQKGGELFGMRTLHRVERAFLLDDPMDFPHEYGASSYAVVSREEASEIRSLMIREQN